MGKINKSKKKPEKQDGTDEFPFENDAENVALRNFAASRGLGSTALLNELDNIHKSPQAIGYMIRGERSVSKAVIKKMKEKFGIDLQSDSIANESSVTYERKSKTAETALERLVSTFESAVQSFNAALESKDKQVQSLERDKDWLYTHIDKLTTGFASLKQTQ